MAYTDRNFKTKKALKEAFQAGQTITVYQPGPFGPVKDGSVVLEGPHYPEPHRWYASGTVKDGVLVGLKGVKKPTNSELLARSFAESAERDRAQLARLSKIFTVGALLDDMKARRE